MVQLRRYVVLTTCIDYHSSPLSIQLHRDRTISVVEGQYWLVLIIWTFIEPWLCFEVTNLAGSLLILLRWPLFDPILIWTFWLRSADLLQVSYLLARVASGVYRTTLGRSASVRSTALIACIQFLRWLFQASICNCLNCVHNCDDHSSLDFKSAVQCMKCFIYHFTICVDQFVSSLRLWSELVAFCYNFPLWSEVTV